MNAGVYQIVNLIDGKHYIGSAIDLLDRWRKHKNSLKRKKHHSIKLQRAWNKYGADAFVFEILLYCDPENCLLYEQIALDHFKPGYNICKIAGAPMMGRKHSQATKDHLSSTLVGNQRARGYKHTAETKARVSKTNLGINLGEKNGHAKLSNDDVIQIKSLLAVGCKQIAIANRFGVTKSTISAIKLGKRRKIR